MEAPLKEHIQRLEMRLEHLSALIMANRITLEERNKIDAEIRAANLALSHYRTAFELEKSVLQAR